MADLLEFISDSLIEFILFSVLLSSSVSSGRSRGMDMLLKILTCGGPCNLLSRVLLLLIDIQGLSCLSLAMDSVRGITSTVIR